MAQNLTTLFGSAGKTRFLQLLASSYRAPVWRLRAYGPDGTTLLGDISEYVKGFNPNLSDETKADSATFVLDNSNARFDPMASGPLSQVCVINNVLIMEKGLRDPVNGMEYLLPAFYGIIAENAPSYAPKAEQTTTIRCGDALKRAVKQKVTSYPYENCNVNAIGADILRAFGKFTPNRIQLAPAERSYSFVQFPDMTVLDALKTLFDPLLYSVRADESGAITTRARLGSGLSAMSNLLGYPDQATAPSGAAVDYVIPDVPGVDFVEPRSQDWDGVNNQIRVLGKASAAQQSLGPSAALFSLGRSSIAAQDKINQKYDYTNNSTSGQNAVVAHNVIVVFNYSTNHNLDTEPRTKVLSKLNWRDAWSASTNYKKGDAVSHSGSSWACSKNATGAQEPGQSSGTGYWDALPVSGPFVSSFSVQNEDPREVGYVNLEAITPSYLVMQIEGRQFSVGHAPTRRHGGFDYNFTIYGQPVLSYNRTLTAYADYNAQAVIGETLADVFDDHQTYQAAHQPLAMSVPVEAFKDGVSLGKITADQTDLSGEQHFNVDFERGRVVLRGVTYQDFSEDDNASHPLSSGGTGQSTGSTFDLSLLDTPAPQALYQTRRDGVDMSYTFPALTVGQGYDIRLHFADPTYGSEGDRVFSIYAQGSKVVDGLDIAKKVGGSLKAYQETLTGIAPDADGVITLHICQNDPFTGNRLDEAKGPSSSLVCGIEVLLPQGQGAAPYAVNCGGPALNPTPPVITLNYGYSPIQGEYEIQSDEINNPLISSQDEAQSVAAFHVNRAMWRRHPHRFQTASLPHVQPGDLLKYYNPRLHADCWVYVSQISRQLQSGSNGTGGTDADTFDTLLLYKQNR